MNTQQSVKVDERTTSVTLEASTLAHLFITVALLIDATCRRFIFHEAVLDLCAILAVSGAISMVYMVRHKVWEVGERFGWRVAIISAVMLIVLAVVGFILAMTKTL
jgi:hypothetical protein